MVDSCCGPAAGAAPQSHQLRMAGSIPVWSTTKQKPPITRWFLFLNFPKVPYPFTSIPNALHDPSTIRIAPSMSFAFKSGIFCSAIALT